MVDQLNSFASEVTRVAREVGTEGILGGQAQVRGVAGTWKDLTDNVNSMAANLTTQVRGIAKVVTAVANGDLKRKLVLETKGEIAELADTSTMHARIFVPEPEVKKLLAIHDVALRLDSQWRSVSGTVLSISPASQPPAAGLIETPDYKGIRLPEFFVVTVAIANPLGEFRDGMTGTAKIHGRRRSMLCILLDPAVTAVARRLW